MNLSASEIITICSTVVSAILAIASVVIVIISIRQNNKMLEASTRPYISIYIDTITICEQQSYFVIKNLGQTPATITDFSYPEILDNLDVKTHLEKEQFASVKGVTLAPSQACLLMCTVSKLPDQFMNFSVTYKTSLKTYTDTFTLHPRKYVHIPKSRPESKISKGHERLVHTMREMVERQM